MMYKTIQAAALLALVGSAYGAIGDGQILQNTKTFLATTLDQAGIVVDPETMSIETLQNIIANIDEEQIVIITEAIKELDLQTKAQDKINTLDPVEVQEKVNTALATEAGLELQKCVETLDVEGARAALEELAAIETQEQLTETIITKLEQKGVSVEEIEGVVLGLFEVYSSETYGETRTRRIARRDANVDEYLTAECQTAFDTVKDAAIVKVQAAVEQSQLMAAEDANTDGNDFVEEKPAEKPAEVIKGSTGVDITEFLTPETMCFFSCYSNLIDEFGSEENMTECPTLSFLIRNDPQCHFCDPLVVMGAKAQCLEYGCSEQECNVAKSPETISGSSKSATTSFGLLAGLYGAINFRNN
jgi:hypothetical protein